MLKQLNDGKETFKKDLDKFEDDFAKKGPMVWGISAAEASKRVSTLMDDSLIAQTKNQ